MKFIILIQRSFLFVISTSGSTNKHKMRLDFCFFQVMDMNTFSIVNTYSCPAVECVETSLPTNNPTNHYDAPSVSPTAVDRIRKLIFWHECK